LVALVVCQTPPKYPTQFSSGVDVVTSVDHDKKEVTVGRLFFDQEQKSIRLDGYRHQTEIVMIERYDLGKQFVFQREHRHDWNCSITDIPTEFPLPDFSGFSFVKKETWRGIDIDVWEQKTAASTAHYRVRDDNQNPVNLRSETTHDGRTYDDFIEYYEIDRGTQDPDLFNATFNFPDVKCAVAPEASPRQSDIITLEPKICNAAATCGDHFGTCGCPYVWGGNSCGCKGKGGFDCSGIVHHCYVNAGYPGIARTAAAQAAQGTHCGNCRPDNHGPCVKGDLFFYNFGGGAIEHVVMYIGGGKVAECPHTGENCRVIAPYMQAYVTCRRHCA